MNVQDLFNVSENNKKVWVDFISYVKRLYTSREESDFWSNPDTFISVYSQGQGLLRSDVLGIPVGDIYFDYLQREQEVAQSWAGRKITFAQKKLLALEEPRNFLVSVITGLQNLFQGAEPLVLVLPSPQKWLQLLQQWLGQEHSQSISDYDVEAVSMYIAEFLRGLSTLGLSAIVIDECDSPSIEILEALLYYQPILNIANHYKWSVGIKIREVPEDAETLKSKVNFLLLKDSDFAQMSLFWEHGIAIGGGLGKAFWMQNSNSLEVIERGLLYGEIPSETEPEKVLVKLKEVRQS